MSDIPPPSTAPISPAEPQPQQDFLSRNKWWVLGGVVVLGAGGLLFYESRKNKSSTSSSGTSSATPQYYELAPGTLQSGSNAAGNPMSTQWSNQQQALQQDVSSLQTALQTYQGEIAATTTSPSNSSGSVNNNASTSAA
jgi:hypothetical protein